MRQVEHAEHVPHPHHGKEVVVVLAGLKDPLNVGQAFRICSSLGIRQLYLCDNTPCPPSAKLNRTARGAQNALSWQAGTTHETIDLLKANGYRVWAVEYATASKDIREMLTQASAFPLALILGNEAHGIETDILVRCDAVVHLPLYGPVSSLNVSTALALAVWEVVR